ncbi:tail fiber protein [Microvirga sp. STS02]|uniref:phage tail protein n=1 Tax=Hymenobacter negativus TaxID=2795026 RepID=UPI0018DC4182|nr:MULTISPECIES: phage tail protein [Bacteria]MBH8567415.1 tail fiber protein [Hymenobacter negativus]MBR7207147.1 tail fiber protein [Microvirga sp. STS02]
MITHPTQVTTSEVSALAQPQLASRRSWLKGLSALLGTGLLATPTALLASPVATVAAPQPASAVVGGDEYIGVVKLLAGTELPSGWALCDGRELPVAQHPALFAVLGAAYGGNGRSTFALPDLRQEMATMKAAADRQPAGAAPLGQLFAIKVANAPATTTAVLELRLAHLHRSRHTAV